MKTLRILTILFIAVLVLSSWAPAPVYAKGVPATSATVTLDDLGKIKLARLRVNNKTGGTLYVSFSGERSYSFATSQQGRSTFESVIQPGKYNITVRASTCSGELHFKRKVKGGTVSLPVFVCRGR
jgi:hypothetical protein